MYTSNKNIGHISDTIKHFPAIKNTLFLGSRHVRQRGLQSNPPTNQVSRISHQVIFKMKDGNKKKKGKVWEKNREKHQAAYSFNFLFSFFYHSLTFEMHVQAAYGFLNHNLPADWSVVIFQVYSHTSSPLTIPFLVPQLN